VAADLSVFFVTVEGKAKAVLNTYSPLKTALTSAFALLHILNRNSFYDRNDSLVHIQANLLINMSHRQNIAKNYLKYM
jgi:hypothetical protein